MPIFHIYKNEAEVNEALAEFICHSISERLLEKEFFTIALTGGNTPRKLYKLLAEEYANKIEWAKVHCFIGDERFVPYEDKRNNARMIFETLLQQVSINEKNVFMMRTDISPERAAEEYERILHTYFDKQATSFDLQLLGLGEDGHTLSLFPERVENNEKIKWCMPVMNAPDGLIRMTITTPVVNASLSTVFFVTGKNKAEAVSQVIKGKYDPDSFPAQLVTPENNIIHWFLDKPATELLADPTA